MSNFFKFAAILMFFPSLVACNNTSNQSILNSFSIEIVEAEGTRIVLNNSNEKTLFDAGETITFSVEVEEFYSLDKVLVNSEELAPLEDASYSFTMPTNNVRIETSSIAIYVNSIDSYTSFIEDLLPYDSGIVSQTYTSTQTDYYGAIEMEYTQTGTRTRYLDNFYEDNFKQISDDVEFFGVNQRGVTTYQGVECFYNIMDYTADDESDYVQYSQYDESQNDFVFATGFAHQYFYNYLTTLLALMSTYTGTLTTNLHPSLLVDNGTIVLSSMFIVGNEIDFSIKLQRNDILTVSNGVIIKAQTTQLYSLMSNTNYQYLESTTDFITGQLGAYQGTRLDPSAYPLYSQS